MGEVYLARHTRLGREVALKLLRADMARDPDLVQRFFQEARVVNESTTRTSSRSWTSSKSRTRAFCVMELLNGKTLADVLRERSAGCRAARGHLARRSATRSRRRTRSASSTAT